MNISTKRMAIAVAAMLACILATLFWPSSDRRQRRDDTIGAAMPLSPRDTLLAAIQPAQAGPKPSPPVLPPPARETPTPTIVTTEDGAYTVQVSSWRSRWKAELDMNRYLKEGFEAYIQRVYLPEKGGVWHRVRIGRFSTFESAAQHAEMIGDMLQDGYWIATR